MKNMTDRIKRLTVCALAFAASVAVMGCGGKKVSEGYWVLTEVSEGKETVKNDDLEDYGLEEAYIVTEDNGEGYAVLFGIPADFEINEDKGSFSFETGNVDYKLSGKKLTLADSNITMVFEKSKQDAPDKPKEVALASYSQDASSDDDFFSGWDTEEDENEDDADEADDEDDDWDYGEDEEDSSDGPYDLSYSNPREYFEGDWYGWMTVTGRTDFWKQINGEVYDAMCKIEMDDDTFGTCTIFDAGMPYEKPIARIKILVNDKGTDPKKGYMCDDNDGFFLDGDYDMHNRLDVDPGVFDWSNYMMIAGTYVDGDEVDAMDYVFHFKKWGDDWSDFSQKPPHYDWYKKLIDAGKPMPSAPPED